jgi:hypothetical protein
VFLFNTACIDQLNFVHHYDDMCRGAVFCSPLCPNVQMCSVLFNMMPVLRSIVLFNIVSLCAEE